LDGLGDRHAVTAAGVRGAYRGILPTDAGRDATASIYAGIAHRCGWLDLDRALSQTEFEHLKGSIGGWLVQDRTLSEVTETFGVPSLWIGGTNPFFSKTLAYTTADQDDDLICVHAWNAFADNASSTGSTGVHPEPVVLAVRHKPGEFPDSFSFTPEGRRRRPTGDQHNRARTTVWIFHGARARYASAVFLTAEAGLAWAGEYHVTGILAEYPYGSAYDAAVSDGRFTPSKPHHGSGDHVAAFAPGLQHIHLTDGRRD
jgi:hypothetical protein